LVAFLGHVGFIAVVACALGRIANTAYELAARASDPFDVWIQVLVSMRVIFQPLVPPWIGHAGCTMTGIRHADNCMSRDIFSWESLKRTNAIVEPATKELYHW
jgi:hypothetical protein